MVLFSMSALMIGLVLLLTVTVTFIWIFNELMKAYILLFLAITFYVFIQVILIKVYMWLLPKLVKVGNSVDYVISRIDKAVENVVMRMKG